MSPDIRHGLARARRRFAIFLSMQICGCGVMLWAIFGPRDYLLFSTISGLALCIISLSALLLLSRQGFRDLLMRLTALSQENAATKQVEELFEMTDMLQAAESNADAAQILRATTSSLVPEFGAALYVFNVSMDRLDLVESWNEPEGFEPDQVIVPTNCWALKRGHPHVNATTPGSLCCHHATAIIRTIEIPMLAKGQTFGLLIFADRTNDPDTNIEGLKRVGRALADSMSLALSNISLRDSLKKQTLRDPLTGLFNRRFMDEVLEEATKDRDRDKPTSVIMIDLDDFKKLNDEHGHSKADAVLRDVAEVISSSLRSSDTVCRYGGEELIAILPHTNLSDAGRVANILRQKVEGLSKRHDIPVTASFGVAEVPNDAARPDDVIPLADAALYEAKASGKNCVKLSHPDRGARLQLVEQEREQTIGGASRSHTELTQGAESA